MRAMVVTLDVSRLSGWLNALAYCRVGKEEGIRGERAGLEVGAWGGGASSVLLRARLKVERRGHARSAHKTCGTWL